MADKPRKRPARPADAPPDGAEPPPAPPEPPKPPEPPPVARPPQRLKPVQPVAQIADPVIPRNPDDVVHNVIVRQLADELRHPPKEEAENPALQTLAAIMLARDEGRPLEPYKQQLAHQLTGGEELNKMTWHLYRRYRVNKLLNWLVADDNMDRFLMRVFRRGDFTPTEALVFKKLSQSTVTELAKELLDELHEGVNEVHAEEVLTKLDLSLRITDAGTSQLLSKTTPQGREIVRKLVYTARQKLYKKAPEPPKEEPK